MEKSSSKKMGFAEERIAEIVMNGDKERGKKAGSEEIKWSVFIKIHGSEKWRRIERKEWKGDENVRCIGQKAGRELT